ncbi:hypothetical protein B0H10DRAFT_1972701 [Mycena sp. CBHHK59/15]|nr:hypothetical protein B0H10DRAFT_1972701 [Mycena sp. CBHHK59/15]
MNKKLAGWEHEGWIGVPHRTVLRCLAAELKARKAQTIFKLAAPGSPERALCRQATELAKNIREIKTSTQALTPRPSTSKMLEVVRREAVKEFTKCKERATCRDCSITEDLEHILIKCMSPGREIIWRAAETLWREKEGTVLGCGLGQVPRREGEDQKRDTEAVPDLDVRNRLLNWRLWNDRVISRDGTPAMEEEIINKWKFTINQRLQVDMTLANRPRKGKHPALAPNS